MINNLNAVGRDVKSLHHCLETADFGLQELETFLHFEIGSYTRNLIYRNECYEMMAICWGMGHHTPIHDHNGQVTIPYSLSAGLDYPGIGPEHSFLHKIKRVSYHSVTDDEAVNALKWLSEKEGIIPALETAHAIAYLLSEKNDIEKGENVIINLSGRGDKDVNTIAKYLGNII